MIPVICTVEPGGKAYEKGPIIVSSSLFRIVDEGKHKTESVVMKDDFTG